MNGAGSLASLSGDSILGVMRLGQAAHAERDGRPPGSLWLRHVFQFRRENFSAIPHTCIRTITLTGDVHGPLPCEACHKEEAIKVHGLVYFDDPTLQPHERFVWIDLTDASNYRGSLIVSRYDPTYPAPPKALVDYDAYLEHQGQSHDD